jgi:uncharacterized membrane protein YcaP (DUF421 family)
MGVDNVKEVKQATLEPSGTVSVLLEDWAKPLQRQDVTETKPKSPKKKAPTNGKS